MQGKIRELILSCGGVPSPRLMNLIASLSYWEDDDLLAAKLNLAFSANLKIDYIHQIVHSHNYAEVSPLKDRKTYHSAGEILKYHFSEKRFVGLLVIYPFKNITFILLWSKKCISIL